MANQSLESVLWESAEKLRNSISPVDYMNMTLGLIFLKYISERFEDKHNELIKKDPMFAEMKDFYTAENIFWVPDSARWKNIVKITKDEKLGIEIEKALLEVERENPELKGILPRNYSKQEIDQRRLGELVDLFENKLSATDHNGDLFGRMYEYFMGQFASNYMQKGGEYFTPRCIVDLLVNMLEPYKGSVYDPCCGSGGMFVQSAKFIEEHQGNYKLNLSVYGQELNNQTWKLAKMNLAIRGIEANLGKSAADTFHNDQHKTERFDYIMSNPPFNVKDYSAELLKDDPRWKYSAPPKGNANYGWIQHILSKLKTGKGVAGFVLANGSISSSSKEEVAIRQGMLKDDVVDCIVTLPDKLFYTVTIPVSLWFLRKGKKRKDEVLFIDARKLGKMISRKQRVLTDGSDDVNDNDIKYISGIYHNWLKGDGYEDIKGVCKSVKKSEIKDNDFSFVPGRYVGIDDSDKMSKEEIEEELIKVKKELKTLFKENEELREKVLKLLD